MWQYFRRLCTTEGEEMKTTLINYRTYNLDKSKVTPIDRRSPFGNPFRIGNGGWTREDVIRLYRKWFYGRIEEMPIFKKKVLALRGHTLGCWCTPLPCHGDVIIKYLNGLEMEG